MQISGDQKSKSVEKESMKKKNKEEWNQM